MIHCIVSINDQCDGQYVTPCAHVAPVKQAWRCRVSSSADLGSFSTPECALKAPGNTSQTPQSTVYVWREHALVLSGFGMCCRAFDAVHSKVSVATDNSSSD